MLYDNNAMANNNIYEELKAKSEKIKATMQYKYLKFKLNEYLYGKNINSP